MTYVRSPILSARLADDERARLRPTVDVDALERFLERVPTALRLPVILHFSRMITTDDLKRLVQIGPEYEVLSELDADEQQIERDYETAGQPARPTLSLRFNPAPISDFLVQVAAPTQGDLLELWNKIEPLGSH